ncbi:uncharacterized protein HD556DRAFT_1311701 [Suillus plorans]|uniref:DUF6533 domain-containing protein n=1 Tax=Suillus plorans TaxID=116603 RepID=A0A9P7AGI4_9AGAM|nr:uncharacterized protein HD556DRAFT_1311701 [Suillus plorans]KAG1788952.1 hypothetical protein HD556DRAFT_1311701 [Suillus plorans]
MEYPSVDITTARSLQPSALSVDSGDILGKFILIYFRLPLNLFIQTYDYICSLHEEWTFLLRSRLTKVKVLYIITRYVLFFIVAADLYTMLDIYACLFVLRTCALWNNNRIILTAILSTIFAIGIWLTTIATSHVTTSVIPDITGCHRSSGSFSFFMQFIVLTRVPTGYAAGNWTSWRSAKGPLYAILLKHNIFCYACGLLLSAINVIVPKLLDYSVSYFIPEGYAQILLRIPTNNTPNTQFGGFDPCNPRYAHAPPSLAYEPAREWL